MTTDDPNQMLTPLTFVENGSGLIKALRTGHPGAAALFYDQHAAHVQRTLRSTLGPDEDIPDLLQEVFIRALDGIGQLQDLDRVRSWLTTIAVFVARAHIRVRSRRNWLRLFSPERTRPTQVEPPSSEARRALQEIYQLLDEFPLGERMAFVLRFVHGMTLPDGADACDVSLATFKRRLARAEHRFLEVARKRPALEQWLEDGTRWKAQKQS
jgi:RNA polymerase sigma-70 factor (ECF subfamily)